MLFKYVYIGDSGGPFLQLNKPLGYLKDGEPSRDFLVGITSFGISEEKREQLKKPGVYTSVSFFREWIDCVIEGEIPKVRTCQFCSFVKQRDSKH